MVLAGPGDQVQRFRCSDQYLLRHTAAQRTGAADVALLDDGDRHTGLAGDVGDGQAGVAGTDDEDVEVVGG